MLRGNHVTVRYGDFTAVEDLSFHLREGEWLMLAGPNGAGKSTLVEAIVRGLPYAGEILLEGREIRQLKPALLARSVGVLSQRSRVGYDYTVEEVVSLGRYAWRGGLLAGRSREDREAVEKALADTGLTDLRHAGMFSLSGGEAQRVFLAQVFAQNPRILLLDEPANHLDLQYQSRLFSLIGSWLREPGRAVLSVVHDLSLARRFGTRALLMDHGRAVAEGSMEEVMAPENLNRVYGMDVYRWMSDLAAPWKTEGSL